MKNKLFNDRPLNVNRYPIKFVYTRRGKRVLGSNAELPKGGEDGVNDAELVGEGSGKS